ncbi:sigma-54-dependent Fis family transcriptional regulator [Methyloversatilis discipulorum]|uniref:sigma-54-dependent Fis family transcriptional regulator n=1 Tax=Methyloversatilis discipulorum TaxID=1119528 RepID=UPI001A60C0A5|nr:sigma-54-dependent Fis family transcriptional regulator [Methyloversatilis discipulorum]MBL8469280.1 sigma-54-dependent Fis family transcriptional regulator [Methyloversatilis discipulorum]
MESSPADIARSEQAHEIMRSAGEVPAGVLPALIETSWSRCISRGLDADKNSREVERARRDLLLTERERNESLLKHAAPVMNGLYAQIARSGSMIVLTNASGFIIHSVGDQTFLDRASKVALSPGVEWSEESKGTNAIGTALVEKVPVSVHGSQHFFSANHFLTCSASPIFDPCSRMLGVLDVTGDSRNPSHHSLALINLAVQTIENQMFAHAFPDGFLLHCHVQQELIGTVFEALLAFDQDGRVLSANRSACRLIGRSHAELLTHTFSSMFDKPLGALYDPLLRGTDMLELRLFGGRTLFGRPQAGNQSRPPARVISMDVQRPESGQSVSRVQITKDRGLERLSTGDAQMDAVVEKVRRVLGRDIPVLIQGETGTGKELLARAIHDEGPRRDQTFVAVNCAAIPDGLIESELFGYEEGAFTGARRKGYPGRIMQADGGTLFLDEIGDMPLALQARLLRVLQERTVVPLGSGRATPVDLSIICATHRKLRDLVAQGSFRADLYYRLNGLTVMLPPLRERSDLRALVHRILASEESIPQGLRIDDEVVALFERHPWPGNMRQLANLLRTAGVMAADDGCIRKTHLPDDFIDELGGAPTFAPSEPEFRAVAVQTPCDLDSLTLRAIRESLSRNEGNVAATARELGISRTTLYRKLKEG